MSDDGREGLMSWYGWGGGLFVAVSLPQLLTH
jgi:hypothetical protein